jgi:hypothetical protein
MSRRWGIWMAGAVLFTIANVGGGIWAADRAEPMHASLHGVLTLAGLLVMAWLVRSRVPQASLSGVETGTAARSGEISDRLSQLEHSVDAVAIEVERIGEGQRFMTRVLTQNAAEPVDVKARNVEGSGGSSPSGQ